MFPDKPYALIGLLVCSVLSILPLLSGFHRLREAETKLVRFTERRILAVWIMFFAVIGIRLLLLPALPVPLPGVHDEFSYLLLGDTFAHGRLANPSHPMWISFETMHVNWNPTYSSMYPPAQGLILAIGQLLGHPWIGVLLSNAAMCALMVWMLQAWIPPRWAFLGGLIAALQVGFASYWMNSYWGGAAAAIGGALVLGSLGRIRRNARWRDALLLGLGIAILANSRPYEGMLFCVPIAIYFTLWMAGRIRTKIELPAKIRRVFLPLLASMVVLATFVAFYNWRLTGNPLLLPHVLNTNTYVTAPIFLWQHAKPALHYRNAQFDNFYNAFERTHYQTTWKDVVRLSKDKISSMSSLFVWRAEVFLLPFVPFLFLDRKMRLPLAAFLLGTLGSFAAVWVEPHYAAPLTCVWFALVVQTMRHANRWNIGGRRVGAMIVRIAVIVLVVETVGRALERQCDASVEKCSGLIERAAIVSKLSSAPGKHLVMVQYTALHRPDFEWVYNGAEIDSAKILWAREMDRAQNEKLFAYFKYRQIWLVNADEYGPNAREARPYPRSAEQSPP
ncbi:MAG TPA: hypothetical protein VJO16_05895 [Candidatus Acidoferrum sp.]|nr:hypothetical protein [Candidatus Acidoferrum sp.]